MKTGKNIATNNFIIRMWSPEHYVKGHPKADDKKRIDGTITCVQTKERIHFHSAGQLLLAMEKLHRKNEKIRKDKKKNLAIVTKIKSKKKTAKKSAKKSARKTTEKNSKVK